MNTRSIAVCVTLLCHCLFTHLASAELLATPLVGDSRLVQFNFDEDNTYLVLAKPKAVTHIQMAQDEVIRSIAAGDTAQWELNPTKNMKNLFVKPKYEGIETSMTVITDKRTYQFVMRSTGDGRKWYQRVSWLYATMSVLETDAQLDSPMPLARTPMPPGPSIMGVEASAGSVPGLASAGIKPESLRFGYVVDGDAPFKPINVFDDGKFIYLRMPADMQEMPALFAVIEDQEYALVNYTIKGEYMVAQRLIETAVLKLGKKEVKITKTKPSTGLMGLFRSEGR